MKKIRIGFVGFANGHQNIWFKVFQENEQVEAVAISDRPDFGGRRLARKMGVAYHDDYRKLMSRTDIDAVVICSETSRHAEQVETACLFKKHILFDKPFADTLIAAERILRAVQKSGVKFMMGFLTRLQPPVVRAREAISGGQLGKVKKILCTGEFGRSPSISVPWMHTNSLSGGGALMNFGVHGLDIIRYLTGAEVAEIFVELSNRIYPEYKIEDNAIATMGLTNGAKAALICGWGKPVGKYHHPYDFRVEILGEKGELKIDLQAEHLEICSEAKPYDRTTWLDGEDIYDVWRRSAQKFIDYLEGKEEIFCGVMDGYRSAELVVAGYRSAGTGKPIRLPL